MKTIQNEQGSSWQLEGTDRELRAHMPANGLLLINNSSIQANVFISGSYVGCAPAYSPFSIQGVQFNQVTISNPDDHEFSKDELTLTLFNNEMITAIPYNPQIDLMEENLNRFATGCNSRVTMGGGVGLEGVIYWVNTQRALMVQRRIEIEGSTTLMGQYEVIFSDNDSLTGSVGIEGVTTIEKRYNKIINNFEYEVNTTNCTISGLMVDVKTIDDVMDSCTLITGDSECYDNNMGTFKAYQSVTSGVLTTVFEVSFDSQDIKEVHGLSEVWSSNNSSSANLFLYYGGAWVYIGGWVNHTTTPMFKYLHEIGNWDGVTGLKIELYRTAAGVYTYLNLYDITVVK